MGVVNGTFVALEFKKSKKATRGKLQIYKKKKIEEAGGVHFWVYPENFDEVYEALKRMCQASL